MLEKFEGIRQSHTPKI